MKEKNENKKFTKIIIGSVLYLGLFLLSSYRAYILLLIWLYVFIYFIMPKIKK